MEWTVTIKEKQYIEIVTRGVADRGGSLYMTKAITMILTEHKIKKALIDQSNSDTVSGTIVDVYKRPKQLQEMGVAQWLTTAEIVKPEHREFFSLLETVCVNRGFGFATFSDRQSALEWLLEQ